ncbi:MAG: enoyl-CoA hydratase/isomerase family protein [Alphaproteobacteria bacterium]|nr:enoyl-CoA hydratase/isomerase family protein [Alphaproteobacteria bacterium]MCB9928412.1 enoyl-CoA hydratase/isomerase family protein [Alphaproteobacteria bacterium]
MADHLLIDVADGIGTLTLNRPDKLNAFTADMLFGLVDALDDFEARDDVQVAILTGAGRAFCSGGDIGGMGEGQEDRPHATKERIWRQIQAFPKRVARFEKPILCAVNGAAVGGGMDLALACDIRVAGASARFAETYGKIGLAPGGGGAYFLPRLVGQAQALELLWTADFVDAEQAKAIGLVNHVWPDADLMAETVKLARRIAAQPPLSIKLIKRLVAQGLRSDMDTAFDLVSSHIAILRAGPDHKEAIAAFKEKRKGTYQGY